MRPMTALGWLLALLVVVTVGQPTPAPAQNAGFALRFFGTGAGDIDRVKIMVDDPATTALGPPVNVGATDFTIEFWVKATTADNPAPPVSCGANEAWITGNIVIDRDRYNQGRKFGVSFAGGRVVFGVTGAPTDQRTICGTSVALTGQWTHIAVQRRRSDGRLWLFVNGAQEATAIGPTGDISYPADGVPSPSGCGPTQTASCLFSDPFLVIGAEKHDIDPTTYRPFRGLVDDLRVSRVLRYSGSFTRPSAPFQPDADTVGLYHFDEGGGTVAIDSSGAPGGPSNGIVRVGGPSNGPQWVTDTPFGAAPSPTPSPSASPPPPRTPSPPTADTRFAPVVARNRQP